MHEFEARLARLVLDYRWILIVTSIALVAAAASGGRFLAFEPDYRVFFDRENPELSAFDKMEATFTKSDNVLFVLAPENDDIFTVENLTALKELTDRSWQITYSTRVDSISNYQHTEAIGDDLLVQDLVTGSESLGPEEIRRIRNIALQEPLLVKRLISPSGHVAGITIRTLLPRLNSVEEVPILMSSVRQVAAEFRARYPRIKLYITGQMVLDASFPEAAERDVKELLPMSFVLLTIGLLVLTRSLIGTLLTMLIVVFSVITALGLRGYSGLPLTAFSGTTPIIILTVAIANCIHILTSFTNGLQQGRTKRASLEESLRINLQPVTLASFTTALGFLTLNAVPMPPLGWMGTTAAVGVISAWLLSIALLPGLLLLSPIRTTQKSGPASVNMQQFGRSVVAKRKILLPISGAVILGLLLLIPNNEINENIIDNNFDHTFEFRRASDFVVENLTGVFNIDHELASAEPGAIAAPEFLYEIERFADWLRSQEEVIHVNVLTDTMKRLNMNLHGDDPDWYRVPTERELSAQYLLLYEMSLPYGLDLNDQINVDKSAIRLSTTLRTLSTRDLVAFEARVQNWLANNTSTVHAGSGVGVSLIFSAVVQRATGSMLISTTVALIAISFLLAIAFRSFKFGVISLIPNLFPAAMGFGAWSVLHGEIGMGLAAVAGLTLGIVIDDTVHFMSKYLRAKRELGLSSEEAIVYSFSTVGRALLVTSAALMLGFLMLATSHFGANADMGKLSAIVIGLALATDFFFLPPLLIKLDGGTLADQQDR